MQWLFLITLAINGACLAQNNVLYGDSKPVPTNVLGVEFPRVDSLSRAIFHVEPPDAQKIPLDLKEVYDMIRGEDSVWTVTTNFESEGTAH
jgi:hypothetical protein